MILDPVRADRAERGSVTVLTAGVLLLVGVLCLASVDLMRALQGRAWAQTAADAAALAAAQELALPSGSAPQAMAAEFASRNGAELVACACDPGSSEAVVEVRVVVSMVMLGGQRTVFGRARAVVEWPVAAGDGVRDRAGQTGAGG